MRAMRLLGVAVVLGWLGSAHAQDASDQRARGHFEAGTSYFEEAEYEAALREFRRAHELSGRPGLLYNLALTEERLGHRREAAALLRRYLAEEPHVPNRDALERRAENLERRADSLEPAGTEGDPASDDDVAPPETSPPAGAAGLGEASPPVVPIVSFGVAGAGLIAAGIFGGLALAHYGELEGGCGPTRSCTPAEASGVTGLAIAADVSLAIAAAGATIGLLTLLLDSSGPSAGGESLSLLPGLDPFAGGRR